jgi:AcrR family transcriptional regulator
MEQELLSRIVNIAAKSILQYGVKGVTMDDIAQDLGMSKKTLYTVVDSKLELIELTAKSLNEKHMKKIKDLIAEKLDPISEMLEIHNIIDSILEEIDPSVIGQLQKFYPEIYYKTTNSEKEAFIEVISKNIKRGISEGIYRSDMDVNLISHLHYNVSKALVEFAACENEKLENLKKVRKEYMIYHLRGISSYKGLSFIESKLIER